jgi:hypothetical protein
MGQIKFKSMKRRQEPKVITKITKDEKEEKPGSGKESKNKKVRED